MIQHSLGIPPDLARWQGFRERIYGEVFTQGRDALFELLDALLDRGPVSSLVELSLSAFFRRAWPSVYAALQDGRINAPALGRLAVDHLPPAERPLLVLDGVPWLLPEARTLPDRGVQHVATTLYTREKLGVGYAYSTLGVVPEESGSWFLPVAQERVPTTSDDLTVGAQQVRTWAPLLPRRGVLVVDSKYGEGFLDLLAPLEHPLTPNAKDWTVADPAASPVDVLGRLKGNRTFYFQPPAYPGQGRPCVHGAALRFLDESTWPEPDQEEIVQDPRWGQVRLRAWHHLHSEEHPAREVTIVLIERSGASGSRREPKRIWLFWYGSDEPALVTLWRWYERRFTIEHWHRFGKQTLNWTTPHLTEEARLGRWGQVVMLATWQLWLARPLSAGALRPWQKRSVPPERRTPGQVRQGMGALLAGLGTPAQAPQRRGQSPGRPGPGRGRKPRYPVVKKGSRPRCRPAGQRTPQPLAA
jgi:hypothetical protein